MSRVVRARRRGVALLAALWLIVVASALGAVALAMAHAGINGAANRIQLLRGEWRAEGCLQEALASFDDLSRTSSAAEASWVALDSLVRSQGFLDASCSVTAAPIGDRLSLASATAAEVAGYLCSSGVTPARADSMAAALVDWRDSDDSPMPLGAERLWYVQHNRRPPNNSPVTSVAELALVRGFEHRESWTEGLGAEPGRVWIARAPDRVIAAAAGATETQVAELRARLGRPLTVRDIPAIRETRSRWDRSACVTADVATFSDLSDSPDGWKLRATSTLRPSATVEYLLGRVGARAVVARRTNWP